MSKFPTLVFLVLLPLNAIAETVLWKGNGTIDSITGSFQQDDLLQGTPVQIRMTYNDQAEFTIKDLIPPGLIGAGGQTTGFYRSDLNLSITITIGSRNWRGSVANGTNLEPFSFFTKEGTLPLGEEVKALIDSDDGGQFPEFPFQTGQDEDQISLSFKSSKNTFIESGITVDSFDPEFITSSEGQIQTGGNGNQLSFTIDPTTIDILFEKDEVIPPTAPIPTLGVTPEIVSLSWQSDIRFRYRVETTDDLLAENWTVIETRNGTDTLITRDYERADVGNFFRVVVVERPSQ